MRDFLHGLGVAFGIKFIVSYKNGVMRPASHPLKEMLSLTQFRR